MSKHAFNQAARFFAETVARVQSSQWDNPGLGVWSVRDLTGHTARALITAEQYAASPAERVEVQRAADYYHRALAAPGVDDRIAERGRQAGAELGPDPARAVWELTQRVLPRVNNVPSGSVIAVPVGAMRLEDYLVTRVFELVVHTLDIAIATSQKQQPPYDAMGAALHLLADLAVDSGHGGKLARIATGREDTHERFSVLG